MSRKISPNEGLFSSVGRAVDESMEIAAAIRRGTLTRPQFDAWYARRTSEGAGVVIRLRANSARLAEPVAGAFEKGGAFLRSAASEGAGARRGRRPPQRAAKAARPRAGR
jgi:hypothetical protein